jgi:hypothetical protein
MVFSILPVFGGFNDTNIDAGYFFPPPKHLFYYRPDLYVHRVSGPAHFSWRSPFRRSYRPYDYSGYYHPSWNYWISPARTNAVRKIYRLVVAPPPTGGVVRVNSSDLIFNVNPRRALVFIDGKLIGSAGDFATERDRFSILDGEHHLRIEYPGYKTFETRMEIVPDKTLHLGIELERTGN